MRNAKGPKTDAFDSVAERILIQISTDTDIATVAKKQYVIVLIFFYNNPVDVIVKDFEIE